MSKSLDSINIVQESRNWSILFNGISYEYKWKRKCPFYLLLQVITSQSHHFNRLHLCKMLEKWQYSLSDHCNKKEKEKKREQNGLCCPFVECASHNHRLWVDSGKRHTLSGTVSLSLPTIKKKKNSSFKSHQQINFKW